MVQWKMMLWCIWFLVLLAQKGESRSLKYDAILGKQKDVIRLLKQINNRDCFETPIYYDNVINLELDCEEIFSVFNGDHLADAKKLYTSFINAKNYEELYSRAAWARQNVNPGLFLYAFSSAVLHSKHTQDIVLPPFYEINPYYFINGNVMKKANQAEKNHTVVENYVSSNDIRYFTEDVGVNSYYYFINLLMPFWNRNDGYPVRDRNGEYYLHVHQQLLARYNLERYALGLNATSSFDYEHPIKLGYDSDLVYPNGESFPSRENNSEIAFGDVLDFEMSNDTHVNAYTYLKDFERKLRDFINTQNGGESYAPLTSLMGINSPNDRSGKLNYARTILGNPTKKSQAPSALEHYETSLRDPMLWPMMKRMLYFYNQFGNKMKRYEFTNCNYNCPKKSVINDNIIIKYVEIDVLKTYFENYTIDLANGVKTENCGYLNVHANTKRLNHKPFSYTIDLKSELEFIFVKVFIGPKYDVKGHFQTLKENRFSFFEIDRFLYRRQKQILNTTPRTSQEYPTQSIKRYSYENKLFSYDRTRFHDFYNEVIDGFIQGDAYEVSNFTKYYGFPRRFMLPKGSSTGTAFQLYVIAIPGGSYEQGIMVDNEYDFNFPFNRPISNDDQLLGPNSYLREIKIYHED